MGKKWCLDCKAAGVDRPIARHAQRCRPHGDKARTESIESRFWRKVDKGDGGDCWLWIGAKVRGYGSIRTNNITHIAHRIAWEMSHGKPPDGKWVLHRCDVRACVRIDHLFLGDANDNVQDMIAKGRRVQGLSPGKRNGKYTHPESTPRGENHGRAQLTDEQVSQIKGLIRSGDKKLVDIARDFGVSRYAIGFIRQGRTWTHVE